jgi:hypothetical protein
MRRTPLLLALALATFACDDGAGDPLDPAAGARAVPNYEDSKADNYVSSNAREFELRGVTHLDLPEGFAELDAEAKAGQLDGLVQRRLNTVAYAVRRHVEGVVREANGGVTGDDARFFTFFKRDHVAHEAAEIIDEGKRARVPFRLELVGSFYLMSKVAPDNGGARTFTVDAEGEALTVEIAGSASRDAFPKYADLFADGVFDIAIHFGGDYNEGRFDIETAKWLVTYLLEGGWKNESVTDFASLTIDSPAFTRTFTVEGEDVEARVYVYHSDMVDAANEARLADAMKLSLAERDVVVYSGHAGPGAGFVLDYQPRFEMPARDFATLPLAEKYQIYVFDGCQTYRTYVDDLMKNPAKTFDNVDIVTTVNTTPFSVGYLTLHQILYWLTLTDDAGRHFPISWNDFLRGLNTEDFRSVHYGVHGIDANPQLNPHRSDVLCQPCTTDADCGAGGNFCLGYGGGAACGVACTTDTACGAGFRCGRITDDPDLFYLPKQCIPRDYVCR